MALLLAAALAMLALPAVASAAAPATSPPPIDATCSALSPLAAVCLGIDKVADALATECRALGLPDADCALPAGQQVLTRAVSAYGRSWLHRAVAFQYTLGDPLPLGRAQWLGTHNSFNSFADGVTLSHLDSNQQLTLTQQLDIDMRALELDTHWLPALNAAGGHVVVCHGQGASELNLGCTSEPPLTAVLPELDRWLNAHPRQVLLLYLDDNFGPDAAYAETVHDLDGELVRPDGSSLIYRPDPAQVTSRGCASLPLTQTRDAVRRAGRQVIIVANCESGWASDVFGWDQNHVESGSTAAYQPYPTCDATYSRAIYATHLVRYFEDSTFVSAAVSLGETPAQYEANELSPAKVTDMTGCGVNLFGFDQILPTDGRLAASVWSWAPGQPRAATGTCTLQRADGRWVTAACGDSHPAACLTPSGTWALAGSVDYAGAGAACRGLGDAFGLPRTGLMNAELHALASGDSVWLRHQLG